jgi:hypothetical protein
MFATVRVRTGDCQQPNGKHAVAYSNQTEKNQFLLFSFSFILEKAPSSEIEHKVPDISVPPGIDLDKHGLKSKHMLWFVDCLAQLTIVFVSSLF